MIIEGNGTHPVSVISERVHTFRLLWRPGGGGSSGGDCVDGVCLGSGQCLEALLCSLIGHKVLRYVGNNQDVSMFGIQ